MESMENKPLTGGEEKVEEYVQRIQNGESKEFLFQGLPESFKSSIEKRLQEIHLEKTKIISDQVPAQYEGLDSETIDFIWTIPEYLDHEKTKSEKERKAHVLEILRQREKNKIQQDENILSNQEDIEKTKQELGISRMKKIEAIEQDIFSDFRMKNGETDAGFFWNEYRNIAAKELKNTGLFEWGKERIYFDIMIQDCEILRNLAFAIAREQKIPIAFKYIDDQQTFPVHKDGNETRFVMNFISSDDARKFYQALSQSQEYKNLRTDRNLDYKGIRIDDKAEYASGFREKRGALERIMNGQLTGSGTYEYTSESGKKITISEADFQNFKNQYLFLEENIEKEKDLWNIVKEKNEI